MTQGDNETRWYRQVSWQEETGNVFNTHNMLAIVPESRLEEFIADLKAQGLLPTVERAVAENIDKARSALEASQLGIANIMDGQDDWQPVMSYPGPKAPWENHLSHPGKDSGIDLCLSGVADEIKHIPGGSADYTGNSALGAYKNAELVARWKPAYRPTGGAEDPISSVAGWYLMSGELLLADKYWQESSDSEE